MTLDNLSAKNVTRTESQTEAEPKHANIHLAIFLLRQRYICVCDICCFTSERVYLCLETLKAA